MNDDTTQPPRESRYERLARVFSSVYAETHSIATALEVVDTHRAREAVAKHMPDLPNRVLTVAASLLHVPASRLLRPDRHRDVCSARWVAAWLLHQRRWSSVKIGRFLRLDHSTVLHGLRRVAHSQELLLIARTAEELVEAGPENSMATAGMTDSHPCGIDQD